MLENKYYRGVGTDESGKSETNEKCKPDYETLIRKLNLKLSKATTFRDAILSYFEGNIVKDKVAELLGELVTECNLHQKTLNELIVKQEKELDSKPKTPPGPPAQPRPKGYNPQG